jgi:hypothetical protein
MIKKRILNTSAETKNGLLVLVHANDGTLGKFDIETATTIEPFGTFLSGFYPDVTPDGKTVVGYSRKFASLNNAHATPKMGHVAYRPGTSCLLAWWC